MRLREACLEPPGQAPDEGVPAAGQRVVRPAGAHDGNGRPERADVDDKILQEQCGEFAERHILGISCCTQ
ncbi:hypothetical protein GCM10011428_40590 [Streptomyces violaceus]